MDKLIDKKVSLKNEVAEREAKKEAARKTLEKKLQVQRKKNGSVANFNLINKTLKRTTASRS